MLSEKGVLVLALEKVEVDTHRGGGEDCGRKRLFKRPDDDANDLKIRIPASARVFDRRVEHATSHRRFNKSKENELRIIPHGCCPKHILLICGVKWPTCRCGAVMYVRFVVGRRGIFPIDDVCSPPNADLQVGFSCAHPLNSHSITTFQESGDVSLN